MTDRRTDAHRNTALHAALYLHVSACLLVVPGIADCQFPVYLWQSLSTTWSSRVHHGGQQQKCWTSRTLYPAGDSINWTSRREIEVTRSHMTVKNVTKAVCVDYSTNASVVCHSKDILYSVTCLTSSLSDIYRVQIDGGGQVNISRYYNSSPSGFILYQTLLIVGRLWWSCVKTMGPVTSNGVYVNLVGIIDNVILRTTMTMLVIIANQRKHQTEPHFL